MVILEELFTALMLLFSFRGNTLQLISILRHEATQLRQQCQVLV